MPTGKGIFKLGEKITSPLKHLNILGLFEEREQTLVVLHDIVLLLEVIDGQVPFGRHSA